jgi:hypothetical protein
MIKVREYWRACRCASVLLGAATCPVAASTPAAQVAAPSSRAQSSAAPQDIAVIYVARRGWHVDIGFAAADLKPPLKSVLDEFPGAQYLFFGFGDRRYLLARHRNAPVLLAALWPGRGMILATGLTSPPAAAFGAPNVVALAVTVRQASDAQDYVWHSLAAADPAAGSEPQAVDQPVKSYAAGPYEGSLFFSAVPKYSALHTCNTWVAEALVAASLPIHSGGVIFAGQLWKRVLRLEKKPSVIVQPMVSPPRASLPGTARLPAQRQGGLVPSWQTTVVPEF